MLLFVTILVILQYIRYLQTAIKYKENCGHTKQYIKLRLAVSFSTSIHIVQYISNVKNKTK